eukprot:36758_1
MSLIGKRFLQNIVKQQRIPLHHTKLRAVCIRYHHEAIEMNSNPRTKDYFNDWRHKQSESLPSPMTVFDPDDTATVFQSLSTYQLIKSNVMFSMLSLESLTNTMSKIMIASFNQSSTTQRQPSPQKNNIPGMDSAYALMGIAGNILSKPLMYLVRKQYFPMFTGGENIDKCITLSKKYYDNNIRLIIDNSTEESTSIDMHRKNLKSKKELVDVACERLSKSVCFVPLKLSGLCSPVLLEEMTHILNMEKPLDRDPTPFMSETQKELLESTITRLVDICEHAKKKAIGVWLDAEQYPRQPAVNYLSRRLMQQFNTGGDTIFLYNTYQCYLRDCRDWITFDLERAQENGYQCGVKLVRGAYLISETERAEKENRLNPIHRTKVDTDRCYDESVEYVLNQITQSYGNVGLAVCTHNRESLQHTVDVMQTLGVERDDPHVCMAQLNGMVDNLTYALGYSGYNALKLIPYGAFEEVCPFLMRRFEENSQILNGVQQERAMYTFELKRRAKALIGR